MCYVLYSIYYILNNVHIYQIVCTEYYVLYAIYYVLDLRYY